MLIRLRLPSGSRILVRRLRREWAELNHAQRRLFELRTGLTLPSTPDKRQQDKSLIGELEALYALPPRDPGHEVQ